MYGVVLFSLKALAQAIVDSERFKQNGLMVLY